MNSLDLCGPNPAPMSCPEVEALKKVMVLLPEYPVVVQIGAYIGLSTMAMLEARPDAFIFSVDIKPHGEEKNNLIKAKLPYKQVVRMLGDSSIVGKNWPVQADFIFIDGDHRYPAVRADIETWLSKVKQGGLIAFHDYIPPPYPTKSRVQIAVDEMMSDYGEVLFADRLKVFKI